MLRAFVPDHILEAIGMHHPSMDARHAAIGSLSLSGAMKERRSLLHPSISAIVSGVSFSVYTADNQETQPGSLERKDTDVSVVDSAANSAYDDAVAVYQFYQAAFQRNSIDGRGMGIESTVHYGNAYDNAFWDSTGMRYGDGDGIVFRPFVTVIDIPGHELSHGVTQYTSNLNYQGQSGALNESFSDCMGSCVKQFKLGQTADKADWLIGEGLFFPQINGRALRDMRNPGTAYNDSSLGGKDPQPNNMSGYIQTSDDNGGVHLNSGIPNKAFADACVAVGGNSWTKVGLVWYKTNQSVGSSCDFKTWAQTTVNIATAMDKNLAAAIANAWAGVGIATSGTTTPPPPPPPPSGGGISAQRFQRLMALVQLLLTRFGPFALAYVTQLVNSLPLSPAQKQMIQDLINKILAGGGFPATNTDVSADLGVLE